VANWRGIPIFGNLFQGFNQSKGYIIPYQNYDQFEKQCIQECQSLKDSRIKPCESYCKDYKKLMDNSILYAAEKCPDANPNCCKKFAGDNDFAYHYCTQRGTNNDLYQKNTNNSVKNIWIVLIFLISFLIFLYFIFYLKNRNEKQK
jgi:ATP-dependent Zn protease